MPIISSYINSIINPFISPLLGFIPVSGAAYMDSIIASSCCDIDATIEDSYDGSSQDWLNLIASPADGAGQADYDFFLGADGTSSTDDPLFTGTAGDDAAYFEMDGGDHFNLQAATNPLTLQKANRKTGGSPCTIGISFRTPTAITSPVHMFSTSSAFANYGFAIEMNFDGSWALKQYDSVLASSTWQFFGLFTLTASTDYTLFMALDLENTNTVKVWVNKTAPYSVIATPKASASDATVPAKISKKASSTGGEMENTTRVYGTYIFNTVLTDAEVLDAVDLLETRHARTYA